jgi:hypothetical protein
MDSKFGLTNLKNNIHNKVYTLTSEEYERPGELTKGVPPPLGPPQNHDIQWKEDRGWVGSDVITIFLSWIDNLIIASPCLPSIPPNSVFSPFSPLSS